MSIERKSQWLASPLGQYLQEQEQALFDAAVQNIFGFHAMQFGMLEMPLLRHCRIPSQFNADTEAGHIRCASHQLPFKADSLDLVLLPHTLDFTDQTHQTLREAARVLVPEGHMILTGFNPLSSWGMRRLASDHDHYPWGAHFISLMRVKDWLALLDCEVVETRMICHMPPFRSSRGQGKWKTIERMGARLLPLMGGVYFVLAKKRVAGMRLIKPAWSKPRLKTNLLPAPTQRTDTQKKHEQ
ncbi:Methyltransferase domain-containing protein [Methylobacillus rhizosphaerae]|uniref:Methyltransferase domain-containing protein n=1 Tax=Methylobacillus rhizosphaerae TaxID=551994 RepID=A0A238ZTJ1_9PROT|nr:methyltransferase domain-containing protein [Methylobacillus rhizosphaerae]SNR86539.1 Methyltransferase domain-containing protein [Methylobacillus rhizosphaerae]